MLLQQLALSGACCFGTKRVSRGALKWAFKLNRLISVGFATLTVIAKTIYSRHFAGHLVIVDITLSPMRHPSPVFSFR